MGSLSVRRALPTDKQGDHEALEEPGGRGLPRGLGGAPMLPREHGAWAMLLVPFVLGVVAAGRTGWEALLLLVSVLFLFASSRPLEALIHSFNPSGRAERPGRQIPHPRVSSRPRAAIWFALFGGIGGIGGLLLVLYSGRWALLPMGLIAALALAALLPLRRRRLDRSWPARLLSIAGLSITGPAAYYVASGTLGRPALAVWLLSFLYSGASLFYVRLVNRPQGLAKGEPARNNRARSLLWMVGYLAVAALLLGVLAPLGWLPPLGGVAFVPLLAKVVWASTRVHYRPALKEIGIAEIGHAFLFALLAGIALVNWA